MRNIWEEIKKDCESGARRLVSEYGNRLYAAALLLCKNAADAEELVFRTLEQTARHIAQYEPKGEFFSWLHVIMRNFRLMDLRKNEPEILPVGALSDLPEVPDAKLAQALSSVDAETVRAEVRNLPDVLSEVLVLRFLEGRSMEEISVMIGIPVGTVKSRLHNAKATEDRRDRGVLGKGLARVVLAAASVTLLLGFVPTVFDHNEARRDIRIVHFDEIRPTDSNGMPSDSQLNGLALFGFCREAIRRRVKPLVRYFCKRCEED